MAHSEALQEFRFLRSELFLGQDALLPQLPKLLKKRKN